MDVKDMQSEHADIMEHEEGQYSSLSALSVGAIREVLYDLHIKKHIWRAPKLLHDTTVPEPSIQFQHRLKVHREETWYELFYDLVFVAAALQIGHIVQSDISVEGLFRSGVLFAVMRATWDQLTFYQNRFDTKDMLHYVFYLLQAMCAFGMAEHLTVDEETEKWDKDRNLIPFAVAVAIARISNATMYTQIMCLSTAYRRHFMSVCISQILSAFLYLLPAMVPFCNDHYVWFWLSALMCERTFVMLYIYLVCPNEKDSFRAPWHMYHLINREGTFILLILGEAIIQLVQHPGGIGIKDYTRGLIGFTVVFNVGDIYYQQQLLEREVIVDYSMRSPSYIWISLHLLLSLSILFFAASIKLVYDAESGVRRREEEFLMCGFVAVSLCLIYLLRLQYKGIWSNGSGYRLVSYLFRFGMSGACAAIPLVTQDALLTVLLLLVVTVLLVLQDLISRRRRRSLKYGSFASEYSDVTKWSNIAPQEQESLLRSNVKPDHVIEALVRSDLEYLQQDKVVSTE